MLINLDGRKIYYDLNGPDDGPMVCFTHSLSSDGGMWAEQLPGLLLLCRPTLSICVGPFLPRGEPKWKDNPLWRLSDLGWHHHDRQLQCPKNRHLQKHLQLLLFDPPRP